MRALEKAVDHNYLAEIYTEQEEMSMLKDSDKINVHGPLYGITYSVADWLDMCGYDSTCGLGARSIKPSDDDAVILRVLNELGASAMFRSNVN